MRFLIAGSSGFLGTRLREQLEATGHEVTRLVRRPPGHDDEVEWDPYHAPLDPGVMDQHDVVVNLAGSGLVGNPYSRRFRERLRDSRVVTTRALAEAIAACDRKPAFLAQNGISFYGDHGDERLDEGADSRGDALMTSVTREWETATAPAAEAGARVCVLRTAPLYDRRILPLQQLRLLFGAGLGGRLGDGRQHMPMISTRDWVDAAVHVAGSDLSGPVNLCCAQSPTNTEFTAELGRQTRRPTFAHVPAAVIRLGMGQLSQLPLDSINSVPKALLDSGFTPADPDVSAVLHEGLDPSR
jgi:uncharacterized protein (TIGR01777 family)